MVIYFYASKKNIHSFIMPKRLWIESDSEDETDFTKLYPQTLDHNLSIFEQDRIIKDVEEVENSQPNVQSHGLNEGGVGSCSISNSSSGPQLSSSTSLRDDAPLAKKPFRETSNLRQDNGGCSNIKSTFGQGNCLDAGSSGSLGASNLGRDYDKPLLEINRRFEGRDGQHDKVGTSSGGCNDSLNIFGEGDVVIDSKDTCEWRKLKPLDIDQDIDEVFTEQDIDDFLSNIDLPEEESETKQVSDLITLLNNTEVSGCYQVE